MTSTKTLSLSLTLFAAISGGCLDSQGAPTGEDTQGTELPPDDPLNPNGTPVPGNPTCADIGTFEFASTPIRWNGGGFDGEFPEGITVISNGRTLSFSSTFGIAAAIIKGGNGAQAFFYDPQATEDSGLHAIPWSDTKLAGISFVQFCWNPEEPPEETDPQWCSPGFWRQPHHLHAWGPTGISPDELFLSYFGALTLSKKGQKAGATEDPTLWEVLQSPQWYGGEAFNLVGDLLSDAHPDIAFNGERAEDSCPL